MSALLIFSIAVACADIAHSDSDPLDEEWNIFKSQFNKVYPTKEHEDRKRSQWKKNLRYIRKHNREADMGKHSYWLGMHEYGDLSHEEFRQKFLCLNMDKSEKRQLNLAAPLGNVKLPDSIDWRTKGYVTPVKNQGACGSCWAFSTTGSLEGQHFKKTGKLVSLSEQNLVDCSILYGNLGCFGGLMDRAFRYIKDNGGIDTEQSYPYKAKFGICRFNKSNIGATLTSYKDVTPKDEHALMTAVGTVGPVSVAIDASHQSFQFYKSGVYDEPNCSSSSLDHGVLAVGYGTDNGKEYWLVKNSWDTSWGMQGYIKMSRNKDNQCGIATLASYPVV